MTYNEMIEILSNDVAARYSYFLCFDEEQKSYVICTADILDLINRQKAEIEMLQLKIEGVQEANAILREHIRKAFKEFAERLCEDWRKDEDEMLCDVDIVKWILDTYKEMAGAESG